MYYVVTSTILSVFQQRKLDNVCRFNLEDTNIFTEFLYILQLVNIVEEEYRYDKYPWDCLSQTASNSGKFKPGLIINNVLMTIKRQLRWLSEQRMREAIHSLRRFTLPEINKLSNQTENTFSIICYIKSQVLPNFRYDALALNYYVYYKDMLKIERMLNCQSFSQYMF